VTREATPLDVLEGRARWSMSAGSCLDMLSTLPDASIDHVITDPPYSDHVHAKSRAGARAVPLASGTGKVGKAALSRAVALGFDSLSTPLRHACAAHFARLVRRWVAAFSDLESAHLWKNDLETFGLGYVRTPVWIKEGCTPQFSGDRPAVGAEVYTLCHPKGRKRWNGGGRRGVHTIPIELDRGGAGNVARVHTTQKPIALMLEMIALYTDPGDVVLDPFAGSATTGAACMRLGRRFIGAELDPTYYAVACERLEAEASHVTLAESRTPQAALFGGIP
jgi:hypothetical protein